MRPLPTAARKHYLWSQLLVDRAVREGLRARGGNAPGVVVRHQMLAASRAQPVTAAALAEQGVRESRSALLDVRAFTTPAIPVSEMLDQAETEAAFARIVASLVQDAGRAAESVATTLTPRIGYVRYVSPPSCSRCAVLGGRVYRYSTGFLRHPHCDCTMVPTRLDDPAKHVDPVELMRAGQITGLSVADQKAISDGADFAQVVNVRRSAAGLSEPGRSLFRAGRMTPEAIYRSTNTREEAIAALISAGYAHA